MNSCEIFFNHVIFELVWLSLSICVQIFFFQCLQNTIPTSYGFQWCWKMSCWPDDFLDMLLLSEAFRSFLLSLIDSFIPRWVSSINFSLLTIHICLQYEFFHFFFNSRKYFSITSFSFCMILLRLYYLYFLFYFNTTFQIA